MKHCPECGSEFQDWRKECLDCGAVLEEGQAPVEEDETEEISDEELAERVEKAVATGEDISELEIEPEEVLTTPDEYELEGSENDFPYKDLVSVDMSPDKANIEEKLFYLRAAGVEAYLFAKQYFWSASFDLLVHSSETEKASQLLKDFKPDYLTEALDATPEEIATAKSEAEKLEPPQEIATFVEVTKEAKEERDEAIRCPMCGSKDVKYKTSLFSSKVSFKCRGCGNEWREG